MGRHLLILQPALFILFFSTGLSCREKVKAPSRDLIDQMNLKRGALVSCTPEQEKLGTVAFSTSCTGESDMFDLGMKLLHSFEYDEAEKVFAGIIDKNPGCAMAYWGVAMSNFHPLWAPPTQPELTKGAKAAEIAAEIPGKSKREAAYIQAISSFYSDWNKTDHYSRCVRFETAMGKLHEEYPDDKEAAILYALAVNAAADPTDKTLRRQRKAGEILNAIYPGQPDHPGIIHYIIHAYDYPELAMLALPAARKYASVAPSSAHALHMPSHIFTRLGLWDECIQSNVMSVSAAKCYAVSAGIKGHWDEELHGMDYLVYAYLQKGQNALAREQLDSIEAMKAVFPANFKVAYAFAAIPSRYVLENKRWEEAARLQDHHGNFPWKDFQWQEAIIHFTRVLGLTHTGHIDAAKAELEKLVQTRDTLVAQKDTYKAGQVEIQANAAEAWIWLKEGKNDEALSMMTKAAEMEDKTEKHPVTPCEVLPARELLGDLLLEMNRPREALKEYEADLAKHPGRWNGLYGAGVAAERSGNMEKAGVYYKQLLSLADPGGTRPELALAKRFIASGK